MKITIGYLYHNFLNLYGDSGNIKALEYHLKEQGINVEIKKISLNEKKEFDKLDFIYIGSGTEENILTALEDLKKDKKQLETYINNNKYILATGNSIELFGNYLVINKKIKALGLFDYVAMHQDRIVKDVKIKTDLVSDEIIGFENHQGKIISTNDDIITNKNFIGTYIVGPILVRNPKLCSKIVHELILSKDKDFKFKEENYLIDEKAYKKTVESI